MAARPHGWASRRDPWSKTGPAHRVPGGSALGGQRRSRNRSRHWTLGVEDAHLIVNVRAWRREKSENTCIEDRKKEAGTEVKPCHPATPGLAA